MKPRYATAAPAICHNPNNRPHMSPTQVNTKPTRRCRSDRVWVVCVVLLITVAVGMRVWRLDSVPGLNGDEAWYGVQALEWLDAVAGGEQSFAWRTPTGNVINPFFLAPQLLVHQIFEPSIAALRATAVASGIVALIVNYWLCCRVFDRRTATISTLLLAVLPQTIAYSRFAWDTSQSVLATVVLIYIGLIASRADRQRPLWFAVTFTSLLAAMVVHPTSVFLVPVVLMPVISRWWYAGGGDHFIRRIRQFGVERFAIVVTASIVGGVTIAATQYPAIAERVTRPHLVALFAHRFSRLVSGVTAYQYIPGTRLAIGDAPTSIIADIEPYDVAFWTIIVLVAYGGWRWGGLNRRSEVAALFVGMIASLAAFYMVAGPNAIAPHWDRYGMWMIAPTVIIVARILALTIQRGGGVARCGRAAVITTSAALLIGFYVNYMAAFSVGGGPRAHRAFRTAAVEPKLAALQLIEASGGESARVVTSEWWTYWPLRYLAYHHDGIEVVDSMGRVESMGLVDSTDFVERIDIDIDSDERDAVAAEQLATSVWSGRNWFVEFEGSEGDLALAQYLDKYPTRYRRVVLPCADGAPLLVVYMPSETSRRTVGRVVDDKRAAATQLVPTLRDEVAGADAHIK
jgi:4-amino-4-deoxy-L-arabinose transferase-like glycosyltransferase